MSQIVSFYAVDSQCACTSFATPKTYEEYVFCILDAQEGQIHFALVGGAHMSINIPLRGEKESLYEYHARISSNADVCRLWNSVCHLT